MGFRNGSYATVWEVKGISDMMTKARISISRKRKDTDEYVRDFNGYIVFIGSACANKALSLGVGDRIKLGDVDVSNSYNKETKVEYTDFKVFTFDIVERKGENQAPRTPAPDVDSGEIEDQTDDENLPF